VSDEPFLLRWSRRKQAASRPSEASVAPAPEAAPAEPAPIEEPPPAETVALEDIAHWLRRNVPEAWRQTALRRLWVTDPVIRDYIGPADYAWDWNTPGGAPGYGPLQAIDDVEKLLAHLAGEPPASPEAPALVPDPAPAAEPPAPEAAVRAEFLPDPLPEAPTPPVADPPQKLMRRRRGGGAAPV
jgi:hypothetical protein